MTAWLAFSKWLWEFEIHGAAPEATKTAGGILSLSVLQDFVELREWSFQTKIFFFFFILTWDVEDLLFASQHPEGSVCGLISPFRGERQPAAGLRCESRSLNSQQMLPLVFLSRKYSTAMPRLSKFC